MSVTVTCMGKPSPPGMAVAVLVITVPFGTPGFTVTENPMRYTPPGSSTPCHELRWANVSNVAPPLELPVT